jgi:hypothetical protein
VNRGIFLVLIQKYHSAPRRNLPNHTFEVSECERLCIRDHHIGLVLRYKSEQLRSVLGLAHHFKIRFVLQQTAQAFAQQPKMQRIFSPPSAFSRCIRAWGDKVPPKCGWEPRSQAVRTGLQPT